MPAFICSRAMRLTALWGDKKQSIYSFQGADPDAFDAMRHHFETGLAAANDKLHGESLLHSFRSSQAILRVVDETFQRDRAKGLEPNVQHVSFKINMPGRVDIWPVVEPNDTKQDIDWTDPVDTISPDHHHVRLADQIAAEIKRMIRSETIPEEIGNSGTYQRRPITEGDILILVQRRSELFSEIIRACKAAKLKIAGADRLRVGAEIAVKDLAALLSFLALPEDDLSLASALKSPLFGWTEQDIYSLAHPRPAKGYLWPALRDHDGHTETRAILQDLAQAMAYESSGVPSLTGFLSWMATDDLEVLNADGIPLWKSPSAAAPPAMVAVTDAIKAKQAEERMRLLYVAMTRAEKWLIVAAAGDVGTDDDNWYNIISDGMRHAGDALEDVDGRAVRRFAHMDWNTGRQTLAAPRSCPATPVRATATPPWIAAAKSTSSWSICLLCQSQSAPTLGTSC